MDVGLMARKRTNVNQQARGELGRTLRTARVRSGLSVTNLAERLGISGPYVSVVERGQRTPSEAVLIRISDVLGLSVVHLLALAGHRTDAEAWPARPLIELAFRGAAVSDETIREVERTVRGAKPAE
jgi:transcriptional regulator with XRE-family HTH domain